MTASVFRFAIAAAALGLSACFAPQGGGPSQPGKQSKSLEGVWTGTSTSSFGLGTVNITLDLYQSPDKVWGKYYCAAGNSHCRNLNREGEIAGKPGASNFRVRLRDTSWCAFLADFSECAARGQYTCYQNSTVVDRGNWKLNRQWGQPQGCPREL